MSFYYIPIRMTIVNIFLNGKPIFDKDVNQLEFLYIAHRKVK